MKILCFDLETSPYKGYFWGVWQQNIADNQIEEDRSILCMSYSWLYPKTGEYSVPDTISVGDYRQVFAKNPYDDSKIIKPIHDLIEQADVVLGHNMDNYDFKTFNTRAFMAGLGPVSPKLSVDTLKILRRNFNFPHNRLDAICRKLGIGGKAETGGMPLWTDVMNGSREAMTQMETYCERDVEMTNELYFYLRAWDSRHPSFNLVDGVEDACPTCGNEGTLKGNPSWVHRAQTRLYPRFKCSVGDNACGAWTKGVKNCGRVNFRNI